MAASGEPRPQNLSSAPRRPAQLVFVEANAQSLLKRADEVLRARHYSPKTIKSYLYWIERYLRFHSATHPRFLREPAVNSFLTHLAVKENVAASTQNQALAALLVFYEKVLGPPLDRVEGVVRARKPKRLPVVLSREEAQIILSLMEGVPRWSACSCMEPA